MEHSEQFIPENISEESDEHYGPPKKQQKYISGPNNGIWTDLQHTKYIVFMEYHKNQMRSKEKRRSNKLFKNMSEYICTRNALQCRSHHQKLEEKHLYPNKIISHFKQHNQLALYDELRTQLEAREGPAEQSGTSKMKLSKKGEAEVPANVTVPVVEVRETYDASSATSPRSDSNVVSGCGFRPYNMEAFIQPGCVSMLPYFVFPTYQFY